MYLIFAWMQLSNETDLTSLFTREVRPALYLLVFGVGLVLNILAAWIFFRELGGSGLVVYLKNMVVADLLMLFAIPFLVAGQLGIGQWFVCRYGAVLFYGSMYVSIVFLGLIGLDRYVKVICSTAGPSRFQGVTFARTASVLTWVLLAVITLPNSMLSSKNIAELGGTSDCMRLKTPLGISWHNASSITCVSIFWAVLLLLIFCYAAIARRVSQSHQGEARRKSMRSIISILLVFSICFVPYHACRVPYTLSQGSSTFYSQYTRYVLSQLKDTTLLLSACNVCLDPVIYFLMCSTFRKALIRKLSCRASPVNSRAVTTAPSVSKV
uniref:Purinergic receptor P2Y14 n=1 Tax=Paramormyrops kingsleyae TaxID=1676925 RepID=A0A3B3T0I9_9TELE